MFLNPGCLSQPLGLINHVGSQAPLPKLTESESLGMGPSNVYTVVRVPSLGDCVRGPQGQPHLQEGLKELRKAIIPMITVYYSERIQIESSKGKRSRGRSPGEARCPF